MRNPTTTEIIRTAVASAQSLQEAGEIRSWRTERPAPGSDRCTIIIQDEAGEYRTTVPPIRTTRARGFVSVESCGTWGTGDRAEQ